MMITNRIFVVTVLVTMSLAAAHADDRRGRREQSGVYYADAHVTDVQPIVRTVQVTTPRQTCWDEPVKQTVYGPGHHRSFTSTVVGGIIGGVVGNQFGSGSGRDAMTVAGALLGASVGRDAAYRRHGYVRTAYGTERRCEIEEVVHEEDRIDGYRVYYRFQGQDYVTQTANDPGKKIRLRVQVNPVAGY